MIFESIFSYFMFIIYFLIFLGVYFYVKKIITANGFNNLSIFILTFSLFYFLVPFIQTFFKLYRDNTSLFTQLLNQLSNEEIFFNLLISFVCLLVIVLSYNMRFTKTQENNPINRPQVSANHESKLFKKINRVADILFILGVMSIVLLINEVGSLKTYLSLGALTRGLDKSPTDYIRGSYLQLVTLSVVILIAPYLYAYLYRIRKSKFLAFKFILSTLFAVLFLFYNQGRAPLVIFFLPFIFILGKKKNLLGLGFVAMIGIFLLNYLDGIFNYLAYGTYTVEENENYITLFLSEFSYPFTNFALKHELIEFSGYRLLFDYIIWPFTMIPSSILNLFGVSKEALVSLTSINTETYGILLGINPSGGIPVDFLTYNFYQYGYLTLFIFCVVTGRFLRKLDEIYYYFQFNNAIKIILYRISFSIITILNNADLSAIIRNRLDVVLLLIILFYIYTRSKKYDKTKNLKGG